MAETQVNDFTKKFSLSSILGKPIESKEQAAKARRKALLGLFIIASLQAAVGILFWWASTVNTSLNIDIAPTETALVILILAMLLYFYNSRIAAGIVVAIAIVDLLNWLSRGFNTGDFGGYGFRILLSIVAIRVAATSIKIHKWRKEEKSNVKLPRSNITVAAMVTTSLLVVGSLFIRPVHFLYHIRSQIISTVKENVIEYRDLADLYSFNFPKTWEFENPPMRYGAVHLRPTENDDVIVEIERWAPWDVPAISLFNPDDFLAFANREANAYAQEHHATVQSLEFVKLVNISAPRAIYIDPDGTKKYIYYIYNRAWTRKNSDGDFFFWRITATVPSGFQQYEADVELIGSSFSINQNLVK